jgi:Ion channel
MAGRSLPSAADIAVVGFSIRFGRRLSWLNVLFALLYLLGDGAIENAHPGIFSDAFFFNVEKISTIGYG